MDSWNPAANEIFLRAIELDDATQRDHFVMEACGVDTDLQSEVHGLLAAHERADGFLESPAIDPTGTIANRSGAASALPVGTSVGPYQLREKLAEGGMGVVYEAEQQEPMRRTVALKIIKPGLNSREVISRFESERQTLALMSHPNIARVLDAGSTEVGQPYFVMELVRGTPINDYCDEHLLNIRERLDLFVQVCQAVQHAHQKGIIHRDIKPSNVLVTRQDDQAVPKVIDFGVAKALEQSLDGQTLQTCFARMVGTPLYMSPEQSTLGDHDVDTRSDIYSLGVLLYEMLTGSTPCRLERMKNVSYTEFRRLKCEVVPPQPSTRVETLGEDLFAVSRERRTVPNRLGRVLRGELDWIVMRALEKDRQRRYQTARGLAADVQRYLRGEPVEAGPPSASYRFYKFVRRHRGLITAAALVLVAIIVGSGVSVWQAVRATRAEQLAERRLRAADSAQRAAVLALERLRRNRAQAFSANGGLYAAMKKYDQALTHYRHAVEIDPNSALASNNLAWFLATCPDASYRNPDEAIRLSVKAIELIPDSGTFWNTLGVAYYRAGNWQRAITALDRSHALLGEDGLGFNIPFLAMANWRLGNAREARGQLARVSQWLEQRDVDDEEVLRFVREASRLIEGQQQSPAGRKTETSPAEAIPHLPPPPGIRPSRPAVHRLGPEARFEQRKELAAAPAPAPGVHYRNCHPPAQEQPRIRA